MPIEMYAVLILELIKIFIKKNEDDAVEKIWDRK